MRIGTWNVEYAPENRLEVLSRVMTVHPADIWVLTETHDSLVPFDCEYAAHSAPRPNQRAGSRWVSIWSRFPIVEGIACEDANRTVCALIEVPGQSVIVYGTVMPWHTDQGDYPRGERVANWAEHDRVVPLQCAEWLNIRQRNPHGAFCAAGDFNTDFATGIRYGTKRSIAALTQGMAACDLFCATAPGRIPEWRLPLMPIDHIVLPTAWASASVVAAWPAFKGVVSDHSGLVVEIEGVGEN